MAFYDLKSVLQALSELPSSAVVTGLSRDWHEEVVSLGTDADIVEVWSEIELRIRTPRITATRQNP